MKTMKVLVVLGTRPEAIKLAPVIQELKRHEEVETRVCVTGQHRELLTPFLEVCDIEPDYDLKLMEPDQRPTDLAARALQALGPVLQQERPEWVLVQGDTTTAFAAALAAFHEKVRIGHVEAGLRSGDKYNPFPEEINRRLISHLADLHFAPTAQARENLLRKGILASKIHVTGNTVIDALQMILRRLPPLDLKELGIELRDNQRLILVTSHRRESFGPDLEGICRALKRLVEKNSDLVIAYPVHLNPNVHGPVHRILNGIPRVHLLEPLDYLTFVRLMERSYLILTDSGGVQEEAPALNKPVLVLRKRTERPEVLETGAARLVGTATEAIVAATERLLNDQEEYTRMAQAENPYGDGHAAERIVRILLGKGDDGTER